MKPTKRGRKPKKAAEEQAPTLAHLPSCIVEEGNCDLGCPVAEREVAAREEGPVSAPSIQIQFTESWCLASAAREGDAEIGAGGTPTLEMTVQRATELAQELSKREAFADFSSPIEILEAAAHDHGEDGELETAEEYVRAAEVLRESRAIDAQIVQVPSPVVPTSGRVPLSKCEIDALYRLPHIITMADGAAAATYGTYTGSEHAVEAGGPTMHFFAVGTDETVPEVYIPEDSGIGVVPAVECQECHSKFDLADVENLDGCPKCAERNT